MFISTNSGPDVSTYPLSTIDASLFIVQLAIINACRYFFVANTSPASWLLLHCTDWHGLAGWRCGIMLGLEHTPRVLGLIKLNRKIMKKNQNQTQSQRYVPFEFLVNSVSLSLSPNTNQQTRGSESEEQSQSR